MMRRAIRAREGKEEDEDLGAGGGGGTGELAHLPELAFAICPGE